jgi:hypothetical protein
MLTCADVCGRMLQALSSRLPDSFKYKLQVLTRDKAGGALLRKANFETIIANLMYTRYIYMHIQYTCVCVCVCVCMYVYTYIYIYIYICVCVCVCIIYMYIIYYCR